MILISVIDFLKIVDLPHVAKIFKRCDNAVFISNECYEDFFKKANLKSEFLSPKVENMIISKYDNPFEFNIDNYYSEIPELVDYYEEVIEKLTKSEEISLAIGLENDMSLRAACKRRNVKCKIFDLSPIRRSVYWEYDFDYLLDTQPVLSRLESRYHFDKFLSQISGKNLNKILTAKEIACMVLNKNHILSFLYGVSKNNSSVIGIAPPTFDYYDKCAGVSSYEIIENVIKNNRENNDILLRPYPGYKLRLDKYANDLCYDESWVSYDFIAKCGIVVAGGSNISFEAMLMGRKVIDISNMPFADKVINNIDEINTGKCTYDDLYLNWMFFCVFIPRELLLNEEYLKWRFNPNTQEIDIFNKHVEYICQNILNCSVNELNDAENTELFILKSRQIRTIDNRYIFMNTLEKIMSLTEKNTVHLCGTGLDAVRLKNIIEKTKAHIKDFVVMESVDKTQFKGKPVIEWDNLKYSSDDYFVITQSNISTQIIVMNKLNEAGIENIIVI